MPGAFGLSWIAGEHPSQFISAVKVLHFFKSPRKSALNLLDQTNGNRPGILCRGDFHLQITRVRVDTCFYALSHDVY